MTLLNPPAPPFEQSIDDAGRYKLLVNENNGGSIVEIDGGKRFTLALISESRLESFSQWLSDTLGQSR
ncbi:hypothetical protein [Bifidobacterium pseudocatenulatum]|uniref:hypothetical protein n=1 Tax=Bifidobacterium pseudocatenulatum TaxID=28026 RepID=UPI003D0511AD